MRKVRTTTIATLVLVAGLTGAGTLFAQDGGKTNGDTQGGMPGGMMGKMEQMNSMMDRMHDESKTEDGANV